MVERDHTRITIARQCELLTISRSSCYYEVQDESYDNLKLMRVIDEQYNRTPFFGTRKMTAFLVGLGFDVNRKRIQRLMHMMGLEAIYSKPKLSTRNPDHKIYPYLLKGVLVDRPDQVWSTDFTYIPLSRGFMYLAAVIDWATRNVLSWKLSNTMDPWFCAQAAREALQFGTPEIFNTDQGSQFTSREFIDVFSGTEIAISMDGRGRALDNVFVERLWRSVKYEDVYLNNYENGQQLQHGLEKYFHFYNTKRPHQALNYCTPASLYSRKRR